MLLTVLAVLFTALFTLLDDAVTPLLYGYTKEAALAYFLASLPTMAVQTVCAAVTVLLLFRPLLFILKRREIIAKCRQKRLFAAVMSHFCYTNVAFLLHRSFRKRPLYSG